MDVFGPVQQQPPRFIGQAITTNKLALDVRSRKYLLAFTIGCIGYNQEALLLSLFNPNGVLDILESVI
jgi:hypothetical protein